MATVIQVSGNISATNLASVPFSAGGQVGALDKLNFVAPPGTLTVAIQPDTGAGDVQFLSIMSDVYDPSALTYTKGSGNPVALDAPHIYASAGMVALWGVVPTTTTFVNGLSKSVNISMLVGRAVTS